MQNVTEVRRTVEKIRTIVANAAEYAPSYLRRQWPALEREINCVIHHNHSEMLLDLTNLLQFTEQKFKELQDKVAKFSDDDRYKSREVYLACLFFDDVVVRATEITDQYDESQLIEPIGLTQSSEGVRFTSAHNKSWRRKLDSRKSLSNVS